MCPPVFVSIYQNQVHLKCSIAPRRRKKAFFLWKAGPGVFTGYYTIMGALLVPGSI